MTRLEVWFAVVAGVYMTVAFRYQWLAKQWEGKANEWMARAIHAEESVTLSPAAHERIWRSIYQRIAVKPSKVVICLAAETDAEAVEGLIEMVKP